MMPQKPKTLTKNTLFLKDKNINIEKYLVAMCMFLDNQIYAFHSKRTSLFFYYLDFTTYRDTGKSFTNDIYRRTRKGINNGFYVAGYIAVKSFIRNLIATKHISFIDNVFIVKIEEIAEMFEVKLTDDEKERINKIKDKFKEYKIAEFQAQIKAEAPYLYAEANGVMDYELSKDIDII